MRGRRGRRGKGSGRGTILPREANKIEEPPPLADDPDPEALAKTENKKRILEKDKAINKHQTFINSVKNKLDQLPFVTAGLEKRNFPQEMIAYMRAQ
eukprot:1798230-Pyramimonas_sp.AAC.2